MIKRINAIYVPWKSQTYFMLYLDLKNRDNLQEAHREALFMELPILSVCCGNERPFRLHRIIIHDFHSD
jgi:hypothetical protein